MYNRYRRCCCQNNYNPEVIETICNHVGTAAEYSAMPTNSCGCGCMQATMSTNSCGCGFDDEPPCSYFPDNPMLAQSYVPMQTMDKTFTPCCGLKMGTIFPELVSPYTPGQSMRTNEYLMMTNEIGEGCNKCC